MSGNTPALLGRLLRRLGRFQALTTRGRKLGTYRRVIAVVADPNPSFDYYLAPRLTAAGSDHDCVTTSLGTSPHSVLGSAAADGALILFCRYVSRPWLAAVEAHRHKLAGVGLFLDDDFEAVVDDATAPLSYRLQLVQRHLLHRARLARLLDVVFVSTPVLAERHAATRPIVLGPIPSSDDQPASRARGGAPRICFHTTGAHAAEHAWLAPVIADLGRSCPATEIEIVATPTLAAQWRRQPRVRFTSTMAWPLYRTETRRRGCDILLAPLVDNRANQARAPTKRIDAYRMGAALVTNAVDIYHPDAGEQAGGMTVPLRREAWVRHLTDLLADRARIAELAARNARHVESWRRHAGGGLG